MRRLVAGSFASEAASGLERLEEDDSDMIILLYYGIERRRYYGGQTHDNSLW